MPFQAFCIESPELFYKFRTLASDNAKIWHFQECFYLEVDGHIYDLDKIDHVIELCPNNMEH